ncbi:MAG: twin-arginine translocase TatA/TatE family subunit [Chloroflexi bacterium]|nr:twin-arginine translocase TatA/TatE family subunit [Chloroflexota bacterium]
MPFLNSFGPVELIIILVIALLVIGPGKLPEVGSALGKSIREFRKAATDVKEATSLEPAKGPAAPTVATTAAPAAAPATVPSEAPRTAVPGPSGDGPTLATPAEPVAAASTAADPDSPAS